jgi:hypothetical protein
MAGNRDTNALRGIRVLSQLIRNEPVDGSAKPISRVPEPPYPAPNTAPKIPYLLFTPHSPATFRLRDTSLLV